jgi:hypothetical protein
MDTKVSKQSLFKKLTFKDALKVFILKAQEALETIIATHQFCEDEVEIKHCIKDGLKWLALIDSALELVDDHQADDMPF